MILMFIQIEKHCLDRWNTLVGKKRAGKGLKNLEDEAVQSGPVVRGSTLIEFAHPGQAP